jgi:hypothetical protein
VIPSGFEPETDRLEICCSIQLSYGTFFNNKSEALSQKLKITDALTFDLEVKTNDLIICVANMQKSVQNSMEISTHNPYN